MNNEEKAKELIGCPCPTKIRNCEACFDRIKVLEMAAWKEKQMIEKAVEWLEHIFKDLSGYNCGGDLINDFKNYMQDE